MIPRVETRPAVEMFGASTNIAGKLISEASLTSVEKM